MLYAHAHAHAHGHAHAHAHVLDAHAHVLDAHAHAHARVLDAHVHMHLCASQVRALDATCRESDSAKGWNSLYALAGRHVSQYGA